jgi:hypothetical protein
MSIVIKGSRVVFILQNGRKVRLPPSYGIIHDPEGKVLPRCEVFFGPYVKSKRIASAPSKKARKYFGSKYSPKEATVDVPDGPWNSIGEVVEILYERTKGSQYAGKYFHPFKEFSPELSKSKRYYRLALRNGCIVDDRGFVFP